MISAFFCLIKGSILQHAFITFFVGYFLASFPLQFEWRYFMVVGSGFLFISAASAVLNHLLEVKYDSLMKRTQDRPIVQGVISKRMAIFFAIFLLISGICSLFWVAAYYTLLWSLVMLILYNFVYTPLKRVTWLNTYIGSFPGALPPVCGWVAVSELSLSLWLLFSVFFIWQIPHFFSLAWKYRVDYGVAGFKMLPILDKTGYYTGWHVLLSTVLLGCGAVWLKFILGFTWIYGFGALFISVCFFYFSFKFFKLTTDLNARSVFLASILYQPILVCLMLIDRIIIYY